ncbi:MAG: TraM recognition domain-containing protein [Candidatus Pacebacteria bacterium]|nr:TraM recognition domain-containing protein [Candidatus Paceibacterota bacterium]MCF7862742.1 TraM recognition domain-containing protein [Candidatus Paceibacterota bacterium]
MEYVTIGINEYRGKQTPIKCGGNDRLRHTYMIGKTGVGKSTIFQNMCLEDIKNGQGTCFIDPHGESIDWLLEHIPAHRREDVILFDPSDTEFPFGMNLLEAKDDKERSFLINECIQIFYKLFDPNKTGIIGPQFEHWLRNAGLTIMADPKGGSLIEIPKLFVDTEFQKEKISHVTDPLVLEFWSKQMAKTADFHKSEMLNYFMSKFGSFMSNSLMRNIIGQYKSSFNFDQVMDENKILLVNLSKGKIGEINAHMLGLIILSKLQASIMRRAYQVTNQRVPFYLYVDEFQNFTTDTFVSLLSESRKYGLGVHLTNQYLAQLPDEIKDAVLGNVGTIIAFEVGAEDAEILAKEFDPITPEDFINLPRFHFYIKLMIDGKTSSAFSGKGIQPEAEQANTSANMGIIKDINHLLYSSPKILIEEKIKNQFI